jgi:hypothetical protein
MVSLQPGDYQVIFGSYNSPKGFLLTFYNQQYSNTGSNLVHVSTNDDTVKNIDATLFKGALITGTMNNNGSPVSGNISAIDNNNPNTSIYQSGYDGNTGQYYLYVIPGSYSIYFQQNNGNNNGVYYNQSRVRPGTAVVVNSLNDTIRNINVDFGTLPNCVNTSSVTNINLCQNQFPFNWNGQNLWGNGTYTVHLMNMGGCDSAAILNIYASALPYNSVAITASGSFTWHGITYTSSTTSAKFDTINGAGCDSVTILNLHIIPSTIWTGLATTNWFDPSNWSNGVPDANTDVVIPAGTPNMPTISIGTAVARNITIANGAILINNAILDLYGKLSNNGTFTNGKGSNVELKGSLTLNGKTTFDNLSVDATYGIGGSNTDMVSINNILIKKSGRSRWYIKWKGLYTTLCRG